MRNLKTVMTMSSRGVQDFMQPILTECTIPSYVQKKLVIVRLRVMVGELCAWILENLIQRTVSSIDNIKRFEGVV